VIQGPSIQSVNSANSFSSSNSSQLAAADVSSARTGDSSAASPELIPPPQKPSSSARSGSEGQFSHRLVNISDAAKTLLSQDQARSSAAGSGNASQVGGGQKVIEGKSGQSASAQGSAVTRISGESAASENIKKEGANTELENQEELLKQAQIKELKIRDREVRAHEQAHAAVGGAIAGSPNFSFTKGPDGVLYAVSGEVSISTSAVAGDPLATLQKSQKIIAAANAPAQPSSQDRAVAAAASKLASQARTELLTLNKEQLDLDNPSKPVSKSEGSDGSSTTSESKSGSDSGKSQETGVRGINVSNINRAQPYEDVGRVAGNVPAAGQGAEAIIGILIDASA